MNYRDYVILKSNDRVVHNVFLGPTESSHNIVEITVSLNIVMRHLVKKYYPQGFDVIIARGRNLESVKKSMPELQWNKYKTTRLTEFANSVPE